MTKTYGYYMQIIYHIYNKSFATHIKIIMESYDNYNKFNKNHIDGTHNNTLKISINQKYEKSTTMKNRMIH